MPLPLKVNGRVTEAVAPMYCKVPPLKTRLATAVALPKLLAVVPSLDIVLALNMPLLRVVIPV